VVDLGSLEIPGAGRPYHSSHTARPYPSTPPEKPLSLNDFQQTGRADAIVSPLFLFALTAATLDAGWRGGGGGLDKAFVTLFSAPQLLVLGPARVTATSWQDHIRTIGSQFSTY
jgi:hypothetical protein